MPTGLAGYEERMPAFREPCKSFGSRREMDQAENFLQQARKNLELKLSRNVDDAVVTSVLTSITLIPLTKGARIENDQKESVV